MKKLFFLISLVFVLPVVTLAEGVPANRLIQLGTNAFQQRAHHEAALKSVDFLTEEDDTLLMVMNFEGGGFVILSADDAFQPIIGYDVEESFPLGGVAPAALYWLNGYKEIISEVKKQHLVATEDIAARWQALESPASRGTRSEVVPALLSSKWNQSNYYNDLCPEDPDSPFGYGGRVPCGCVALAMASVIHYYRYPATGQGSHSYYSNYGYHAVNYGQQTYNYNAMPYALSKANNEVAKLIYHCAIAVEMGFAPEGSGAQTEDTRSSLKNYYKYSNDIAHADRSGGWGSWGGGGYTDEQWIGLLQADLDNGYPIIYSGYGEEGGHAFVCDGYDSDDLFHFNFGWGGTGNGYFTVATDGANAVGGFASYQDVVYHIHPPLNNYPTYCQNITVNSSAGSLEDGSGHLDYQNNTNCTYVIQPENGKSITIGIVALDLEDGHDFLRIYDGNPDNGGNLVAEYTGNAFNPTDCPYIQGPAAYVRFTSDAAGTAGGWRLRFTSKRYVSCTTTTRSNEPSGTFTDGSGDESYAFDASCRWIIEPINATYVTLNFTQFDLSSEDHVTIYNGDNTTTAGVLATYTGTTLPASVISHTGKMMVLFESDNYIERSGFAATWSSDGEDVPDPEDPEDPNAISEVDDTPFELYPNPANQQLSVIVPERFHTGLLRIFDANGRMVRSVVLNTNQSLMQLPLTELTSGVYIVTLSNTQEILHKKLIISR